MVRIEAKKIRSVLKFHQSKWLKPYTESNARKVIKVEKNSNKDGKVMSKLMNNAVYGKTMENLRNRNDARLASNEKYFLK